MSSSQQIADAALDYVRDEHGVRVEDYLTVLAAMAGEAVLLDSGVFGDLETTDLAPGAAVFGDPINDCLDDAFATLKAKLPDRDLGDPETYYKHTAANVNGAGWGDVVTSVPADHEHRVLPLRAAFELREAVTTTLRRTGTAEALALALEQTKDAIDPQVAVTLALEILFAMAKMVPMSQRAFAEGAASDEPAAPGA